MNFVALDVETTGTLSHLDRIVELAAVRFSEGKLLESFSTLVNPGRPIPEEASLVNGITDEMLKDKPKIADVLKSFSEFCSQDVLVAHNAVFDFQFLSVAFEECHLEAPRGSLFDTYALSKKLFPGFSNYKLSTLVECLKLPGSNFHRAKQDAEACGHLFDRILKQINTSLQNRVNPKEGFYTSNFSSGNSLTLSGLKKLTQLTGKKELRFPALKAQQLSFPF